MANKIFKCKVCGGQAKWDPQIQKIKCEFCDTEFELSDFENNDNIIQHGKVATDAGYTQATDDSSNINPEDLRIYKCAYCGAEIITDKTTAATTCVFCNNPVVIQEQLATEFKPQYVIPFKISKSEVENKYLEYIRKPFTPNSFLSPEHIQKIKGIYIPFWLYDIDIDGEISAEGENVRHYSNSKYNFTEHKLYYLRRGGKFKFRKIPTDASSKTPNDAMDSIEPFDFNDLKPFNMAYLAGFLAERYDESKEDCLQRAKIRAEQTANDLLIQSTSGYSSISIKDKNINTTKSKAEYVMLPTYLLFCKYNNKDYLFAMNGQTGKSCGNIPIDKKKVFKYIGTRFAAIFCALSLIGILITMFT